MNQGNTGGLTPVASTNIRAVGYQDGVLTVAFKSGGTYTFRDVPQAVYEGLLAAESKGRYFHFAIRGQYAYSRVERTGEDSR